jgi:hypothetical protein
VQFTADAHPGLAAGTTTRTYRTWKRPQAKTGGRYAAGPVVLEVDTLERVEAITLTTADAVAAGEADLDALLRRLGDATVVWRVDFHRVDPPDAVAAPLGDQADLTPVDLDAITARLDRLDRASPVGPWTRPTLRAIADRPGTVSTELAADLGRERFALKADIRKLKRLGLTESLIVGYQLSPRGRAYRAAPPRAGRR